MTTALASATYNDTWAGPVPAVLKSFRTKRRGQSVTRYRWHQANGHNAGGFAPGGFVTVEGAVAAAQRHANFSNVTRTDDEPVLVRDAFPVGQGIAIPYPAGWQFAETSVES